MIVIPPFIFCFRSKLSLFHSRISLQKASVKVGIKFCLFSSCFAVDLVSCLGSGAEWRFRGCVVRTRAQIRALFMLTECTVTKFTRKSFLVGVLTVL